MKKSKKPQFVSKQEAFSSFFSWFTAPVGVICIGVYFIVWWSKHGVEFERAKQSIYLLVVVFLGVLIYSWYKAFLALKAINSSDYEKLANIPDFVMCAECLDPMRGKDAIDMKCQEWPVSSAHWHVPESLVDITLPDEGVLLQLSRKVESCRQSKVRRLGKGIDVFAVRMCEIMNHAPLDTCSEPTESRKSRTV